MIIFVIFFCLEAQVIVVLKEWEVFPDQFESWLYAPLIPFLIFSTSYTYISLSLFLIYSPKHGNHCAIHTQHTEESDQCFYMLADHHWPRFHTCSQPYEINSQKWDRESFSVLRKSRTETQVVYMLSLSSRVSLLCCSAQLIHTPGPHLHERELGPRLAQGRTRQKIDPLFGQLMSLLGWLLNSNYIMVKNWKGLK